MPTEIIRSRQNPRVKQLRDAFAQSSRADATLAVEGEHLLEEALRSGLSIEAVFVREDAAGHFAQLIMQLPAETAIHMLSADVFNSAVFTETPQGIAAFIKLPERDLEAALATPDALVVVLDAVQDPGNVGTIVRSAEAFGATAVLALLGTASFWNQKTLRASAGSVFRLPVFALGKKAAMGALKNHDFTLVAAVPRDGAPAHSLDWKSKSALLIGGEGPGLSENWLAAANQRVTLECAGPVESLNAAVAASLLLYEASKHRRSPS